jgi:hypothetical protein
MLGKPLRTLLVCLQEAITANLDKKPGTRNRGRSPRGGVNKEKSDRLPS